MRPHSQHPVQIWYIRDSPGRFLGFVNSVPAVCFLFFVFRVIFLFVFFCFSPCALYFVQPCSVVVFVDFLSCGTALVGRFQRGGIFSAPCTIALELPLRQHAVLLGFLWTARVRKYTTILGIHACVA